MDVELKNIHRLDGTDTKPPPAADTNISMTAASNPAYIPDGEELRHRNKYSLSTEKPPLRTEDDQEEEYSSSEDEDDGDGSAYQRMVSRVQESVKEAYTENKNVFWTIFWVVVAILYFAYFTYSMIKTFDVDDEGSMRLLIVTILVTVFILARLIIGCCLGDKEFYLRILDDKEEDVKLKRVKNIIYWILVAAAVLIAVIYVIVDVAVKTPRNLVSAAGMAVFVLLFYIFSHNPAKVKWRPVFWGLVLQFYFALFILRSEFGYRAFEWLGNRVQEFLAHTDAGSSFVFGSQLVDTEYGPTPAYEIHFFGFKVLTVIIFFSSAISVLYYWGVMQFIIKYIARFLAWCLGTSPTESLNAAGNIFIGQINVSHETRSVEGCVRSGNIQETSFPLVSLMDGSEAPLMIRPFLKDMTKSELHAVCTGGFATIAGSVLAAYILMKVPANHLLSASVMSAPAALAMSKLFYPETKKSKATGAAIYNMPKGEEKNFIEAASNGASLAISLVANIAANLIAFIALLHFVDSTLTWLGHRADLYEPELTFELICSYVFWPLAFLMGCDSQDSRKVGALIGTKTFLNEFVAYSELGKYINNNEKYYNYMNNVTGNYSGLIETYGYDGHIKLLDTGEELKGGILTDRTVVIATYALCGFSNIGSIGIMLGALGAMAPHRKRDITKIVVRAMIAGNVACFMTACIAGLLYEGPI